mmetsp:Transcript_1996/g.5241  ORF Transcript_1996/g.5241 Transcript_1996/m.5241 type:complete len:355 (+) Transcript_1996:200-1264(+)
MAEAVVVRVRFRVPPFVVASSSWGGVLRRRRRPVDDAGTESDDDDDAGGGGSAFFRKATVAVKLLVEDPKMKHMIGLNASFGFASAFLNSYVNGQVLPVALDDPDSEYVGVLTSTVSVVAAGMSLVFGRFGGADRSNGTILVIGALCFGMVVAPFLIEPDATRYGWASLSAVYCLHGTGRATFEGTLRSTFADYFPTETEGAFANIVLQNGIAGGVGYILTFALTCETPGRYCIRYRDGSLHDVRAGTSRRRSCTNGSSSSDDTGRKVKTTTDAEATTICCCRRRRPETTTKSITTTTTVGGRVAVLLRLRYRSNATSFPPSSAGTKGAVRRIALLRTNDTTGAGKNAEGGRGG